MTGRTSRLIDRRGVTGPTGGATMIDAPAAFIGDHRVRQVIRRWTPGGRIMTAGAICSKGPRVEARIRVT